MTASMPLPPNKKIDCLRSGAKEVRDKLAKLYQQNGGEEVLNLQA
jgi:hypothetical protein